MNGNGSGGGIIAIVGLLFSLVVIIAIVYGMYRIFTKAGKPGWHCIIPILANWTFGEIIYGEGNGWKGLLSFIPAVGGIIAMVQAFRMGECFGKDTLYSVGLVLLPFVFVPMLGLGGDSYKGPVKSAI